MQKGRFRFWRDVGSTGRLHFITVYHCFIIELSREKWIYFENTATLRENPRYKKKYANVYLPRDEDGSHPLVVPLKNPPTHTVRASEPAGRLPTNNQNCYSDGLRNRIRVLSIRLRRDCLRNRSSRHLAPSHPQYCRVSVPGLPVEISVFIFPASVRRLIVVVCKISREPKGKILKRVLTKIEMDIDPYRRVKSRNSFLPFLFFFCLFFKVQIERVLGENQTFLIFT